MKFFILHFKPHLMFADYQIMTKSRFNILRNWCYLYQEIVFILFVITLTNGVGLVDFTYIKNRLTEKFCDDLSYWLYLQINIVENLINTHLEYGLYFLAKMLESAGKTFKMCDLPTPQRNWHPLKNLIGRKLAYNFWDEAIQEAKKLAQLNVNQLSCF